MSPKRTAEIRAELKKQFPDFKFSVRTRHHSTICVSVLEAPFNMLMDTEKKKEDVNYFYIADHYEKYPKIKDALLKIYSIMNEGNYTVSVDSDYGNIPSFYVDLQVGEYDKPFKVVVPNKKVVIAPKNEGVIIPKVEVADGVIKVVEYSEKSFALVGTKTKELKNELVALGGRFNFRLTCGAGWIFSNKNRTEVDQFLTKLGLVQVEAIFAEAKERFEGTLEKLAD